MHFIQRTKYFIILIYTFIHICILFFDLTDKQLHPFSKLFFISVPNQAKLQIVVDKFACFIKPQLLSAYTKVLRIPACLNQPHTTAFLV